MATEIGSTDSSGCPVIKIKISGAYLQLAADFEVTVDTGFTGFMSIPIMTALPLGMALIGTTSVQFADGTTATRYTAIASAFLGTEMQVGIVILEPSSTGILVGMEFLQKFQKSVLMHRGVLFLIDQAELDKVIQASFDQYQKNPVASAPDSTPPASNPPPSPAGNP
jgi:predicted aspartyl protease